MPDLPEAITDAASAEAWAEHVRSRVATTPSGDTQVYGPEWVIDELEKVSAAAAVAVVVVKDADRVHRQLAQRLAKEQATVRVNLSGTPGTVGEKTAQVVGRTQELIAQTEDAEAALDYAKSVAKLVEGRKSAVQTIARMVETTYALAGRGR